ncbi:type I DNA topoisomerase [Vulgatibacter sp.]|uniref:type I DNA topoisomerase n=1 Tax=Vulgatibacter sp. TaxID=1971226 RepID=UPI00356344E1
MPRNEKTQTLVIVESPTKAKTIRKFLPPGYRVEACMGHVRDLPTSAAEIPEKVKKEPWARLGVNVEKGFDPLYVVPRRKTKVVRELKDLLKDADHLLLATDEDREGESISWHLLEVLKPKVPFERLVFHEITKDAIRRALEHPRSLDDRLVRAQETRRILDRLVGYGLSPLLWKKIAFGLSAGRVQSVAVDVIVRRERERMAFRKASYWDLLATVAKGERFDARLIQVGEGRVATGKDFDEKTGALKVEGKVVHLDEAKARALVDRLRGVPFTVLSVEEKPVTRRPPPPLITSTMQQEANRKLGMSAQETMRTAQSLYERGLITYMRTDSVHLSNEAITAARRCVGARFGEEFLSPGVRQFKTSTKGAQEAHEAIRPSADFTAPKETGLTGRDYDLYELIWMRTLATQMADAQQTQISVRIGAGDAVFSASGMRIVFPGFLRAYVEGSDDAQAALEERERLLPAMKQGDVLALEKLVPEGHETKPPARFTEASLIQFMEKEGIGRPSTFASIVGTIIDRGYVVKQGNQLVPTFTGFVVTDLLEKHFPDLVDVNFTSSMEQSLDAIAEGQLEPQPYLHQFFLGDRGLQTRIENEADSIDPRDAKLVKIGDGLEGVEIHVGKFGPYLEVHQDGGEPRKASIPDDVAPGDLSLDRVHDILEKYERREQGIGVDPASGKPVFLKTGSYGPYVQLGDATDEEKPKRASLPPGIQLGDVDLPLALRILELPRLLGTHPQSGKEVRAGLGRFGPYVVHDGDFRSLKKEDDVLAVGLDRALELLAQPKGRGRGAAAEPLKTVGNHPADQAPIFLYSGRYGFYVKHGEKTATVSKGEGFDPEKLTLEQAVEALANAPEKKGKAKRSPRAASGAAAKTAKTAKAPKAAAKTAAKATAKKPATRKPGTKKGSAAQDTAD